MRAYDKLMEKYREITLIDTTIMMMNWDLDTYMPPGGIDLRGNQMDLLERLRHRMLTSEELLVLMNESENDRDSFNEVQSRNLHLMGKEIEIANSVPEDLVAAYAKQTAIARDAWARARTAKDWKIFEPELEKMVEISTKRAEASMDAKGTKTVFDSMIYDFERGMTSEHAASLLSDLRRALVPLADKYSAASEAAGNPRILRSVPLQAQREVVRDAVNLLGYDTVSDKARGRIDETLHPFTIGYYDDMRIALKYRDDGLFDSLLGGMHEAGHAMYGMNIDRDWIYQPLANGASMGVHESCSRFVENMIGTSRSFWTYYLPRFKNMTGSIFSNLQLDDLMRGLNRVKRSKIRVEADEVTYSLHVAIRFEIERALFTSKTTVKELPHMWNDLYDRYLQVTIDDDVEGVMQDIHWSTGAFGYFQSYALGNVYDGMYLNKLEKDMPAWQNELELGRPGPVLGWLKENVHRWGSLYDPEKLVEHVAGSPLSSEPFVKYLERKYSSIWG